MVFLWTMRGHAHCGGMHVLQQCDYTVGNMGDLGCITDHDQFDRLILNPDVLSIAFIQFMMFKKQQGRAPEHLSNKQDWLIYL